MQPQEMLAFFLFAVAAAATPGPSNTLLMAAGARAGWAGGLRCLAGVVLGMALLIAAAALGLAGVLQARPQWLAALRIAGSGFLLWMAWKIASSAGGPLQRRPAPVPGFWAAFLLQWVNPKSWIVGAGAAAAFGAAPGQPAGLHAMLMASLFALAAGPSCTLWLLGGALLQRWMDDGRRARLFHRGMGLLLALSVGMLWV